MQTSLSMDIVKPPAKTNAEDWERFQNRIHSELTQTNRYRKQILVRDTVWVCLDCKTPTNNYSDQCDACYNKMQNQDCGI